MNKKEIITLLETDYKKFYDLMDDYNDKANEEKDNISLREYYRDIAGTYASKTCYIAEILAKINDSTFDHECERLHNKFNLWRFE